MSPSAPSAMSRPRTWWISSPRSWTFTLPTSHSSRMYKHWFTLDITPNKGLAITFKAFDTFLLESLSLGEQGDFSSFLERIVYVKSRKGKNLLPFVVFLTFWGVCGRKQPNYLQTHIDVSAVFKTALRHWHSTSCQKIAVWSSNNS